MRRRLRTRGVRALVLLSATALGLNARADPAGRMQFTEQDPCGGGNASYCAPRVLAEGDIAPETPAEFQRFLAGRQVYAVSFNSRGGTMQGAMEMGRLIRRRGLDTYVAPEYSNYKSANRKIRDVVCASACVVAFAGGVRRSIEEGARIGVHQLKGATRDAGEGATQVAVVALALYYEEMGIRRELVDIASVVPPQTIYWLKESELTSLGLDNTNLRMSTWRLDALDDGTVVAKVSQTKPGSRARVTLAAMKRKGRRLLVVVFTPDDERDVSRRRFAAEALSESDVTLMVDGRPVGSRFPPSIWTQSPEGLSTTLELSSEQATALRTGKLLRLVVFMPNALRDYDPSLAFPLERAGSLITAALK